LRRSSDNRSEQSLGRSPWLSGQATLLRQSVGDIAVDSCGNPRCPSSLALAPLLLELGQNPYNPTQPTVRRLLASSSDFLYRTYLVDDRRASGVASSDLCKMSAARAFRAP